MFLMLYFTKCLCIVYGICLSVFSAFLLFWLWRLYFLLQYLEWSFDCFGSVLFLILWEVIILRILTLLCGIPKPDSFGIYLKIDLIRFSDILPLLYIWFRTSVNLPFWKSSQVIYFSMIVLHGPAAFLYWVQIYSFFKDANYMINSPLPHRNLLSQYM